MRTSTAHRRRGAAIVAVACVAAALALVARPVAQSEPPRLGVAPSPAGVAAPAPRAAVPASPAAASPRSGKPSVVASHRQRAWTQPALAAAAAVSQFVRLGARGATPAARALLAGDRHWPRLLVAGRHRRLVWLRPLTESSGCVGILARIEETSPGALPSRRAVTRLFTVRKLAGDGHTWLISAVAGA